MKSNTYKTKKTYRPLNLNLQIPHLALLLQPRPQHLPPHRHAPVLLLRNMPRHGINHPVSLDLQVAVQPRHQRIGLQSAGEEREELLLGEDGGERGGEEEVGG